MLQLPCRIAALALALFVLLTAIMQASEPCAIHGTVTDLIGEPLPRTTVTLVSGQSLTKTQTDAEGWYCFKSVSSSEVEVRGYFPGFYRVSRRVWMPEDGPVQVDLALKVGLIHGNPDRFVQGVVRDEEGHELADVLVIAICVFSPDLILSVRTDEQGKYRLNIRQSGQYIIVARRPGRSARSRVRRFKGQPPPQIVDFSLPPLNEE